MPEAHLVFIFIFSSPLCYNTTQNNTTHNKSGSRSVSRSGDQRTYKEDAAVEGTLLLRTPTPMPVLPAGAEGMYLSSYLHALIEVIRGRKVDYC